MISIPTFIDFASFWKLCIFTHHSFAVRGNKRTVHFSKCLLWCFPDSLQDWKMSSWVNDDSVVIFAWTTSLNCCKKETVIVRLINDTCLKTRVGKDARAQGEGRNQIHLTHFFCSRKAELQPRNRDPQTAFLQFVPFRLFHEFVTFFWKGRQTPYLRRSMNSAGRVTLFFLLIVLITQGKLHCIQDISTFYKYNNFELYYLLCVFVPIDLNGTKREKKY